jgi:Fe2+ transport system protein FeoA
MSLKEFPLHRPGVISEIETGDSELLSKLLTIGALPHTEVELLQRRPTFVIRMGYSTFAVDEELASCIYLKSR